MDLKLVLIEILLAGFFAVACLRARDPISEGQSLSLREFFILSGRVERLRRSRWAWFSLVGFMLVLRLQQQLPVVLELMIEIEFALFMALPAHARQTVGQR